jgi:glycosyltransferase involved in cell wall biosynthesis
MRSRVLYIQHASVLGGSCVSLLYTIQALDQDLFEPIIALVRPSPEVERYYRAKGIEVIAWEGIKTFEHTTAGWTSIWRPVSWPMMFQMLIGFRKSLQRTTALIRHIRPDVVHLNSIVLAPSALALHRAGQPFVWHVREAPVRGLLGLRRRLLSLTLRRFPAEVFFISEADRLAWRTGDRGIVVPNFVDRGRFDTGISRYRSAAKKQRPTLLFVGGTGEIKGLLILLKALAVVRHSFPDVLCLLPAVSFGPPISSSGKIARAVLSNVGIYSYREKAGRFVDAERLTHNIEILPFQSEIWPLMERTDVLVFPAIRPHFARPIIEAAAYGIPAIASDLPGARELVEHGKTGILTPVAEEKALAAAIIEVVSRPDYARELGLRAWQLGYERYSGKAQMKKIQAAYQNATRDALQPGRPKERQERP